MERFQGKPELVEDAEFRRTLAEIQRIAFEFMLILRAAAEADPQTTVFTSEKLRETLGGTLLPDDSHARDTQFELYVPALFANAGFEVLRGEPDARLVYFGEQVGIEAKRAHSLNADTLRSALSVAARQITGKVENTAIQVVRLRGFIAINVDVYLDEVDSSQPSPDIIQQVEKQLQVLDREARVLQNKAGILGLLACGHVARWRAPTATEGWHIDTLFPTRFVTLHGDDPVDEKMAYRFTEYLARIESTMLNLRTKCPRPL